MSSREDAKALFSLSVDFSAIDLEPRTDWEPYFCTPQGAEPIGWIGCDGVHFVLLPGDERVYCVDPAMGEEGTYVLPWARTCGSSFPSSSSAGTPIPSPSSPG